MGSELEQLKDVEDGPTARRMETRLTHLFGRVDRMQASSTAEKGQKAKFASQVVLLISEVEDAVNLFAERRKKGDMSPTLSIREEQRPSRQPQQQQREQEQSLINLESLPGPSGIVRHSSLLPTVGPLPKPIPVSKWNLKFFGDLKSISVNAFIEPVGELGVARNVTREELFNSGADLFTDQALLWYRDARIGTSWWSL